MGGWVGGWVQKLLCSALSQKGLLEAQSVTGLMGLFNSMGVP